MTLFEIWTALDSTKAAFVRNRPTLTLIDVNGTFIFYMVLKYLAHTVKKRIMIGSPFVKSILRTN